MKKQIERKKRTLAYGEVSNHSHVLERTEVAGGEINKLFTIEKTPDRLVHEEHGVIEIPVGDYMSGKVVEYDHFKEETKRVQD